MSELKPCANCAGEATRQAPNMHRKTCIVCKECGMSTGRGTVEEVTATWNRRAQPANEPLTLEELREMDGDYAYFQFGDGAEGNAIIEWQSESRFILYGPVADDHGEPDIDFINMEFDDPDGHFGLHILGWRAYHRPPERSAADGEK